jgi:adenine-specific DNA methylase
MAQSVTHGVFGRTSFALQADAGEVVRTTAADVVYLHSPYAGTMASLRE